jgi:Insect cuticle protein
MPVNYHSTFEFQLEKINLKNLSKMLFKVRDLTLKFSACSNHFSPSISKFVCLAALVAVATAQYDATYQAQPAPAYKQQSAAAYKPATYSPSTTYKPATYSTGYKPAATGYKPEYEGPAEYTFNYNVNAPETYDEKSQSESLKDGYTVGQYSLIDADGMRRTVDYTADDYNGFQATVRREPVTGYSAPAYTAPAPKYQAPAYQAPSYQTPKYPARPTYTAPAAYPSAPAYPSQTYAAPAQPAYQAPAAYPAATPAKY